MLSSGVPGQQQGTHQETLGDHTIQKYFVILDLTLNYIILLL